MDPSKSLASPAPSVGHAVHLPWSSRHTLGNGPSLGLLWVFHGLYMPQPAHIFGTTGALQKVCGRWNYKTSSLWWKCTHGAFMRCKMHALSEDPLLASQTLWLEEDFTGQGERHAPREVCPLGLSPVEVVTRAQGAVQPTSIHTENRRGRSPTPPARGAAV